MSNTPNTPPSAPQCEQGALKMLRKGRLDLYDRAYNHGVMDALAQGTTPAAGVGEQATGVEAERAVLYVVRAKRDGKNFIKGELFLNEVTETEFEVSEPDDFECLPLYEHPARAILAEAGIKEKTNG